MRYTYDQAEGLLYVYFGDGVPSEQVELDDGSIADVAEDGSLIGFEVLNLGEWNPDLAVKTFDVSEAQGKALAELRNELAHSTLRVTPGHLIGA